MKLLLFTILCLCHSIDGGQLTSMLVTTVGFGDRVPKGLNKYSENKGEIDNWNPNEIFQKWVKTEAGNFQVSGLRDTVHSGDSKVFYDLSETLPGYSGVELPLIVDSKITGLKESFECYIYSGSWNWFKSLGIHEVKNGIIEVSRRTKSLIIFKLIPDNTGVNLKPGMSVEIKIIRKCRAAEMSECKSSKNIEASPSEKDHFWYSPEAFCENV